MWKLQRLRQCEKCPWRKATNPRDIPDGYDEVKHKALASTIAKPGEMNLDQLNIMACHETHEAHCVGWLVNQVGPGNNIGLRIAMMSCENARSIRLRGEQHETFEDTLPKGTQHAFVHKQDKGGVREARGDHARAGLSALDRKRKNIEGDSRSRIGGDERDRR